jgi:hypothetical protein
VLLLKIPTQPNVVSGVPQGSVFGPILFILFFNDIDHICHSVTKLKLFANDDKTYCVIDTNSISCSLTPQQPIVNICNWAELWQFSTTTNKTTVNILSTYLAYCSRFYSANNVVLPHCHPTLELAITIDRNFTFREHITTHI